MIVIFYLVYFILPIGAQQQNAALQYFFKRAGIETQLFTAQTVNQPNVLVTNLDEFRDLFVWLRGTATENSNRMYKNNYKYAKALGKVQQQISPTQAFPCGLNNTRSSETPTSVHRLRPGDIDIIGAMGDSLTAGTGMMSKSVYEILAEYRGQTILGGGLKDWRSLLTLPNIFKVFNPRLYGYAVANTLAKNRAARFNVAEPSAMTKDMPFMAEVLLKRLQHDKNVNMKQHWKMISIFIGANDICIDQCFYNTTEDFLMKHRRDLYRTLKILKDNIPRLMVNIISIPNIDKLAAMKGMPLLCDLLHRAECPCVISDALSTEQRKQRAETIRRFQQIDIEVASLPEFQLEEFAAVPRTLAIDKNLRTLRNGNTDLRYFAADCFHFSQYGNAAFANMFWNELLQANNVILGDRLLSPFEAFACPTENKPYLSTLANR